MTPEKLSTCIIHLFPGAAHWSMWNFSNASETLFTPLRFNKIILIKIRLSRCLRGLGHISHLILNICYRGSEWSSICACMFELLKTTVHPWMCPCYQRAAVLHQSLIVFRNEAEMFWIWALPFWPHRHLSSVLCRTWNTASVCAELQSKVLQCYREKPQQTLHCSGLAKDYMACVQRAKVSSERMHPVGHHWVKCSLTYSVCGVCVPEMVCCQHQPSENVQAFLKLSRCFLIEVIPHTVFNCQKQCWFHLVLATFFL